MDHVSYPSVQQNDFLEFKISSPQLNRNNLNSSVGSNAYYSQVPQQTQQSYEMVPHSNVSTSSQSQMVEETLNQLKVGFSKMMSMLERLDSRISKVEQTTTQILKNQQEVLQVPFMSQTDLDNARQVAEQLERDTTVAKQLQAAFNKEVDVRKTSSPSHGSSECPICGLRVGNYELETHVDKCLAMFSNDPKKETQVKETQKKVEAGFFAKMFKGGKTEKTETTTTTTKTVSTHATAPNHENDQLNQSFGYFGGYPQPYIMTSPQMHGQGHSPVVMPMYMYPSYPNTHMTTQLQDQ